MSVVLEQLKALYRLSRGTQASLSIAQPVLGVFLATTHPPLGRFVLAVGLIAAGFFGTFAFNDLLDAPLDRARPASSDPEQGWDLERAGLHPLARGRLTYRAGVSWAAGLCATAIIGLAVLSWAAMGMAVAGILLEAAYCALARVSPYKFVLSGILVACAALTGWFAFTGTLTLQTALFALWMAAWEIGGRNIPNDMADIDGDARLGITTMPTVHGLSRSASVSFGCLLVAAIACTALALAARSSFGTPGVTASVVSGLLLLVVPGLRMLRDPSGRTALALFNGASFQPACVLLGYLAGLWW